MTRWIIIAVVSVGVLVGGYFGTQAYVNYRITVEAEKLKAKNAVLEQTVTTQKQDLLKQAQTLKSLRTEYGKAKAQTVQVTKERDQAIQSAAAAAAAREQVHVQVAAVPESEVRSRLRAGLSRLGLVPPGSPSR